MEFLNNLRQKPYFTEIAFLVAIVLILMAWKFGVESIVD